MGFTSGIVKLARRAGKLNKVAKKAVASPANVTMSRRSFLKILGPAAAHEVKATKAAAKRVVKVNMPRLSVAKPIAMAAQPNKLISRRAFLKGAVSAPIGHQISKQGSKTLTKLVNPRRIFANFIKKIVVG